MSGVCKMIRTAGLTIIGVKVYVTGEECIQPNVCQLIQAIVLGKSEFRYAN
ncbi:hypothetical protein WN55_05886 [Dufourea novaeangliae]|uniref:Uncharacterized protein n=1 Tax=Dufourea novaeangliae TaxID=178035 RepID=A0A154PMX9_DUFNO|nr:hypothetical protein WN55_05886 [Dufourea novaeangliae]